MIPEAMPEPVGEGAVPETFVPPEHDFKHDEEKPADTPPDLPFQEAEVVCQITVAFVLCVLINSIICAPQKLDLLL